MAVPHFSQIDQPAPTFEEVQARYATFDAALQNAKSAEEVCKVIADWDILRCELDTWHALTDLRFNQDTRNETYKAAREYCDQLSPKLTELAVAMKRQLLGNPQREALEAKFGTQVFALWEADITTYDPAIEQAMVRESELETEFIGLLASAELPYQGETYTHATIVKFLQEPERDLRYGAEKVRWQWFADNAEQLDRIYDDQVRLRHEMACTLGFENYTALAYKRMSRIDYDRQDVENYRDAVRQHVVPLALELREKQRQRLGVEELMAWDEPVADPNGNPKPQGDHDWMLLQAQAMFDEMGGGLDDFFRLMTERGLIDLKSREGKADGGFCTAFPVYQVPFIYANFNGTKGDVEVFTHEVGHAFQCYESRKQPLVDYLWPTYESCEIHSMSLEFLTWPQMEKFFGDDADRFRQIHLEQSLIFLPYGVAVDHFQHLVYDEPTASPERRKEMWREMEAMYLPWRNWGDLEFPAGGGRWQFQRHIYLSPFYYIDYTLAQTCALQFWVRSREDFSAAMEAYVALCRRGGEAPFQELATSAGLISPFKPGCLEQVVQAAREVLA